METTANVSTDLEAVTDLVLKRQLIDVQRDHAKGIVKMVLDCATEAAGPVEPAYKPNYRRINVTVESVSTLGFGQGYCDHVLYTNGWADGAWYQNNAYGPPRNDAAPTALTDQLRGLIGHNVALWVTDDEFITMPTILQFNDFGLAEESVTPAAVTRVEGTLINTWPTQVGDGSFTDEVTYITDWAAKPVKGGVAFTPLRDTYEATELCEELIALNNHDVALWVTEEEPGGRQIIVRYEDLGKRPRG